MRRRSFFKRLGAAVVVAPFALAAATSPTDAAPATSGGELLAAAYAQARQSIERLNALSAEMGLGSPSWKMTQEPFMQLRELKGYNRGLAEGERRAAEKAQHDALMAEMQRGMVTFEEFRALAMPEIDPSVIEPNAFLTPDDIDARERFMAAAGPDDMILDIMGDNRARRDHTNLMLNGPLSAWSTSAPPATGLRPV